MTRMSFRRVLAVLGTTTLTVGVAVLGTARLAANHPVLVEGNNCANGAPGTTTVLPRSCGDYDGDGLIGTAEDTDNDTDRIFGTLTAALGAANGGVAQNGRVTIVTSGRFAEVVQITGNVTLEAAPGVEANIDAVLAGAADNNARMGVPGIIVNAPANRYVIIRNIVSRNWAEGIQVRGDSRVSIENCRLENNTNFGIRVAGNARVSIVNTSVTATGFRLNPGTGDFPGTVRPNPGAGIGFEGTSRGLVAGGTITGSVGPGLANYSTEIADVQGVVFFDNTPNTAGSTRSLASPETLAAPRRP